MTSPVRMLCHELGISFNGGCGLLNIGPEEEDDGIVTAFGSPKPDPLELEVTMSQTYTKTMILTLQKNLHW